MDKTTMIRVLNRDNGEVVYSIPEMNGLRRVFQPGETKEISFEELQKLSYFNGGRALLEESLVIQNPQAVKELLGNVEVEYSYTVEDIKNLMKNGTLDEFLDCLDFAPEGVKDLIKNLAVAIPLNDVEKREAILNKLGFNVDNAIRIRRESQEETAPKPEAKRRVTKSVQKTTSRRVVKGQD